ncbi:MAG: exopolysaccharide biosynthesis polyprenyl glycosylphosphotransferase [bacterium]
MRRVRFVTAVSAFLIGDVAAVLFSYVAAYLIRNNLLSGLFQVLPEPLSIASLSSRLYLLAIYPFVFAYEGLYTKRLTAWEEVRRCLRGVVVGTAFVLILLFLWRFWVVSRFVVVIALPLGMVAVPLARALVRRLLVRTGLSRQPLVIVGGGPMSSLVERELVRHWTQGYEVVERVERPADGEPAAGVLNLVRSPGATLVVLADSFSAEELKDLFMAAERRFPEVLVVPNESLLHSTAADVEHLGTIVVMKYRYNLLRPLNRWTKRVFELAACVVLLALLWPLLAALAMVVKLSSRGPALFRQTRVGLHSRQFACLKLRTMFVHAENRLPEILARDPGARAEWERFARLTDDPRVTGPGRFLRRFSFDELPQLLNVMRGEMALVGPRPYLPSEIGKVGPGIDTITRVRPGMTGLWQVSGRAELPFAERVLLDEYYIRNWSLWMDFSILLRTARAVFGARGAY